MPIYAYRCDSCGHAQDVLQRLSDPLLTVCPACGAATFTKQVTAAGFQLKGSGWYVTDFKNNGAAAAGKPAADGAPVGAKPAATADAPVKAADSASATPAVATTTAATPAPAPSVAKPAADSGTRST